MKIDIRIIPIHYINLDSQPERGASTQETLSSLGFSSIHRVSGCTDPDPKVGCACPLPEGDAPTQVSHPSELLRMILFILEPSSHTISQTTPTLFILGAHNGADYWTSLVQFLQYKQVSEDVVRICNMLPCMQWSSSMMDTGSI